MAQSPTVTATGRVIEYGDVETRGKWSKRVVVVEIEPPGEYAGKYLAVEFGGKKLSAADDFGPGDQITVTAYVGSREYQGKWYSNIAAKSVTVDRRAQRQQAASEPEQDAATGQDADDVPF